MQNDHIVLGITGIGCNHMYAVDNSSLLECVRVLLESVFKFTCTIPEASR
jgi:hypothetical protein